METRLKAAEAAIAAETTARNDAESKLAVQAARDRQLGYSVGAVALVVALIMAFIAIRYFQRRQVDPSSAGEAQSANASVPGLALAVSGIVALLVGSMAILHSLRMPEPVAGNQTQPIGPQLDTSGSPLLRGSCPIAWCNCDGLAIVISGGAGLVRRPLLAG